MRTARLQLLFLVLMLFVGYAQENRTYVARYLSPFPGPQCYKDVNSGTIFYVETDGRHVAAISSKGKLLWNRDPFKDAHLEYYRTMNPQIVYIGPVSKSAGDMERKFVAVSFNSSQFGMLRISDGEFRLGGRD